MERRYGLWIAVGGLTALAIAGQLIINQSVVNVGRSLGQHWSVLAPGYDFRPIWEIDFRHLHGIDLPRWYGPGISNAWPPPHEVIFAPLALLPVGIAQVVTIALAAGFMVVTVLLLTSEGFSDPARHPLRAIRWQVAAPMLLAAPVIGVIWIDQLQAALGLASLTVAIWAQRRNHWWLAGIAGALGMIRVLNAIPVICILLLGGWGKPRQLAVALGAAAAFMAPLLFVSYLWDHAFISDYIAGLTAYPYNGAPKVATKSFGIGGLALLLLVTCVAAVWLMRSDIGRPLDPGRAGLALAMTVAIAPLGGLYAGIFTLPALIRLGLRPGFAAVPWIATVVPWVVILALAPWLLGANPGTTLSYVSFIDYGLLLLCYPLLRIPPEADRSVGRSAVIGSAA